MIDFGKIYCNLHPHELITNFCSKDQCLVGLCANCVCTHTQAHISKGTAPDYENIRATYKKVQESIRSQVELFEKDKARIDKISEKVVQKRRKVKQIMDLAKDEVSILLGTYFDEKQKNMVREIEAQEKKYGLHCQHRLQSLNSYISREVSNLVSAAQQISSTNFLESLPRVRTQCLVNSAKLHQQIEGEIIQNQKFSSTISCDKGLLRTLVDVLEKAITVSLNNQPQLQKFKQQQERFSRPKSQGKGQILNQPTIVPMNNFIGKERNVQSQITIGQGGYFQQQGSTIHNYRPMGEIRRSTYLNDIQNFVQQPKIQESTYQKVSMGSNLNQHLASIVPSYTFNNISANSNNSTSSNSNGFRQQPFNLPLTLQSPANLIGQRMIGTNRINQPNSLRNLEKPQNNGASGYQIGGSAISEMLQSGKQYQKGLISGGLNKKSRKSGLRLMTAAQIEPVFPQNNQNLQNQKPWGQTAAFN